MLITRLQDILYPPGSLCMVCDDPRKADPVEGICKSCREKLDGLRIRKNFCPRCLSPVKYGKRCDFCRNSGMEGITASYAPFYYHDEARALIIRMKFGYCNEPAQILGREMASELPRIDYDGLVPVPLHMLRERERGANQAKLLSEIVARITGIKVMNVLNRVRYTKAQSQLEKRNRKTNVEGAFSCCTDITGLDLLLVDDVRTTGATARSCAKELLSCGAASVSLLIACVAATSQNRK